MEGVHPLGVQNFSPFDRLRKIYQHPLTIKFKRNYFFNLSN